MGFTGDFKDSKDCKGMYEVKMKFPVGCVCVVCVWGGGGSTKKSRLWEGRGMDFCWSHTCSIKKENMRMSKYERIWAFCENTTR